MSLAVVCGCKRGARGFATCCAASAPGHAPNLPVSPPHPQPWMRCLHPPHIRPSTPAHHDPCVCMGVAPLHVPPRPFCSRAGRPQNPLPGPCRLGKRSLHPQCKTAPGRWPMAHRQAPQPPDTIQGTMPGGWRWGHGPWGRGGSEGKPVPVLGLPHTCVGQLHTMGRSGSDGLDKKGGRAAACRGGATISRGAPPRLPLLATRHFHVYGRCGRWLGSGYLAKGPFYAVPCFLSPNTSSFLGEGAHAPRGCFLAPVSAMSNTAPVLLLCCGDAVPLLCWLAVHQKLLCAPQRHLPLAPFSFSCPYPAVPQGQEPVKALTPCLHSPVCLPNGPV
jgi:hypothetical protein